jgi:sodium/potassium/calcium exchanger 4
MSTQVLSSVNSTSWCTEGLDSLCLEAIDHTGFGVFIEIVLLVMCFFALALLCDEYLIPAIECLCLRFKIREDVAGALFVALGSSAPEIIINAIAAAKGQVDSVELGIGAVIGSGCIAFLLIPAICTLFSPTTPVEIKRRPLLRDVIFYFVSLLLVIWFILDGEITLIEAGILCGLYVIYLLVVVFSSKIRLHFQLKNLTTQEEKQKLLLKRSVSFVDLIKQQKDGDDLKSKINAAHKLYGERKDSAAFGTPHISKGLPVLTECDEETEGITTAYPTYGSLGHEPESIDAIEDGLKPLQYMNIYTNNHHLLHKASNPNDSKHPSFNPLLRINSQDSLLSQPSDLPAPTGTQPIPLKTRESTPVTIIDDCDDDESAELTLLNNPLTNALYFLITFPIKTAFSYTIPEAQPHGDLEHLYPISFGVSFLYLALFSMVISAVFSRWVVLTGLGGDFFGLIMVSAAAELPDMIQSIAASKAGYSSMAMACLSSQIANILVGFGFSWFISIFARRETIKVPGFKKLIHSAGIQLGNVVFFAILTLGAAVWYGTNKVEMVKLKAQMMLIMYGIAVVGFAVFAFVLHGQ